MKIGVTASAGFMAMLVIATSQYATAQENQSTPVPPQQNDQRSAVAKINPQRPIQIRVVSQTNVPIIASLAQAASDRPVLPGRNVTFGRLHTSYLTLPIDMQVSLQTTPDPDKPTRVFLDIKTAGNEIIVTVRTSPTGGGNSSQTINVDEKGLIYLY
ncbi:hypothetical protein [Pantanalinema sp. GBBB05]|uniref:hypothetical protein n=1 Tax=Pantanalinema sp. GBBB05 TaxID=2604139 RepID=UPI001DC75AE1|nr:hypothetical protein [Pantanalinema sp. GBBB05]